MTAEQFIERVLTVLNDVNSEIFDAELIGSDEVQMNNHIRLLYPSAWRKAVNLLPKHHFRQKDGSSLYIVPNLSDGTGYIILPNDFYRLANLRMKGWKISCFEALPENEQINRRQQNEYTRGSFLRPVCVLRREPVNNNIMVNVIWYYSLKRGLEQHEIEKFAYIPIETELPNPVSTTDTAAEIIAWITAEMMLTGQEKTKQADIVQQKYLQML
ncbi:MAG: hypothetical protein LBB53_00070 [Prevotellaceae bacterium]|nr:hypothetical protein [Prevotellaceae bacterium]